MLFFGGREVTAGNAFAVRRLTDHTAVEQFCVIKF